MVGNQRSNSNPPAARRCSAVSSGGGASPWGVFPPLRSLFAPVSHGFRPGFSLFAVPKRLCPAPPSPSLPASVPAPWRRCAGAANWSTTIILRNYSGCFFDRRLGCGISLCQSEVQPARFPPKNILILYGTLFLPPVTLRLVIEASIIQGRQIGAAQLEQVRQLLQEHPESSRWRISQRLATLWNWRNGAGQLKDMAARTLLLKLEQRGSIVLPPRRHVPPNRMRPQQVEMQMAELALAAPQTPIIEPLRALLPLSLSECSQNRKAAAGQRALFNALLRQHHYLGHNSTVGEHLQYLVSATFVDTSRFQGRCYRAANWQQVGLTTGRTRQNKTNVPQSPPKAVWLYPLGQNFRQALCV